MTYTIFNTFRPYDFGTDAIERQRVSLGQSIIDADFEYGLQGTKWQAYQEVRKTPGFFEIPGTDYTVTNVTSDGASPQSLISVTVTPPPASVGTLTNSASLTINQTLNNLTSIVITAQVATVNTTTSHFIATGTTFLVTIAGTAGGTGTLNGTYTAISTGSSQFQFFVPTATASGTFSTPGTSKFLTAMGFTQSAQSGTPGNGQFVVSPPTGAGISSYIQGVVTLTGWNGTTGTLNFSNQTWITGTIPINIVFQLRTGNYLQHANTTASTLPNGTTTNGAVNQTITNSGSLVVSTVMTVTTSANHNIATNTVFSVQLIGTAGGTGVLNGIYNATSTGVNTYTIDATQYGASGTFATPGSSKFLTHIGVTVLNALPIISTTNSGTITVNAAPATTSVATTTAHNIPLGATFPVTISGTAGGTGVFNGVYTATSSGASAYTVVAPTGVSGSFATPGSTLIYVPAAVTTLGAYIAGAVTIPAFTSSTVVTITYPSQTWLPLSGTIPTTTPFILASTATPGTQPFTANVLSITGLINASKSSDRAEGFFPLVGITTNNSLAYFAKGVVPAGQINTSYTVARRGGLFNNGNARIQGISTIAQTQGPDRVTVTTTVAHGLVPGTPITAFGWLSPGGGVNGNFFLETVPSATTFTYTPRESALAPTTAVSLVPAITGGYICVQTYSSAIHRPFDGGVLLAAGQPTYGSNIVRQSKKVFRYQSGKGLLWSSGTLFCPNNDILAISSAGTAVGSLMGIVTEIANGLPQPGATVQIIGVTSTGFNTVGTSYYTINSVLESTTASMLSLNTISGVTATNVTVSSFVGDGTTVTVTATAHGLRTGTAVSFSSAGVYTNAVGVLISVTGVNTFTYLSSTTGTQNSGTATTYIATLTDQPRFIMKNWHGASVRAGCFEDQNGLFWEYDGQTLFAVKRSSTFQLAGLVYCSYLGQTLTGNSDTRFIDQIRVGDRFVIRGMAHTVTGIASQSSLTFNPPYRGTTEITALTPVRACKVKELRYPQSAFNRDKLDGTGNSGFTANLAKMQMIGIQYTWYGAGFVDFMMRGLDGNWVYAHRIYNNNVNDEAYMRTGNMPVRYELTNECSSAISTLNGALNSGVTSALTLADNPVAYWPTAGTVLIENELITYTGKNSTQLTGLTRGASLTYNIADSNRTFTGGVDSTHATGVTVNLVSTTCTPSLTHWGSAFIMDGQFDNDRGYFFNYTFNQTAALGGIASGATIPLFFLRLSPSVSNGIVGDIGTRDLLNRAQLLLQKLDASVVGTNVTLNVQGILNPSGFENSTFPWLNINSIGQGSQPSFTQYCNYNTLTLNGGSYVAGSGERIFSLVANGGSISTIDLSALKELSNTVIGGNRMFPDGPDTLMIIATALNAAATTAVLNLYWTEAQA